MEIFYHHIYEYLKGVRNLVLHTEKNENVGLMIKKLNSYEIHYLILPAGKDRVNVFFGDRECVDVIRSIGKQNLVDFTAEEDFMLGIMLGYDIRKQCERYLNIKKKLKIKIS